MQPKPVPSPEDAEDSKKQRSERMSERERDIMKTIGEALPNMSDFEKGYLLGVAESRAEEKKAAAQKSVKEDERSES